MLCRPRAQYLLHSQGAEPASSGERTQRTTYQRDKLGGYIDTVSREHTERGVVGYQPCDAGRTDILSLEPTFNPYQYRRDSMTDAFYAATAIHGHDHDQVHAPLPNIHNFTHHHHFGAPTTEVAQEDDGQISCFCGYPDDDGNTVACDSCNRWQHTICYYPEYDGRELPVDLSHYCVDCRPQHVNAYAANARQRSRREQPSTSSNGAKRQVSKSHKKKVKEPNGVPYTNGWPLDKSRHDRNSASPRDQPPPAKRPKTTHRTSDTATNSTKGHSRKRTITNGDSRSVSRSPESPIGLYSEEFLRCYHHDEWSPSHANVMDELRVTNALSQWLQAPDDEFFDQIGIMKADVLNRWDGELDDIPGKVPLEVQPHHDPGFQDEQGNTATWKSITVRDPLAAGAYIGELRGRIGFKDEYKTDPANRWPLLRHPEPFVFFHHRLPIYIDARHEGTALRYVRRSCTPNARLQVLVTNGTDYHFCFMATTQIDPGMEVAVGWDTTDSILRQSAEVSQVSQDEMAQLSTWVSNVLANCGPCACQLPPGECRMSRFDKRRTDEAEEEEEAQSSRLPKPKKKRNGQHISPLDTHALNSRSGSEAHKVEPDEEPTDSRSASGSAGRGSDSRDNTPNTHYSANGSLSVMPELSERERKKLAREEEIFRRQEEEQSGKQAKKKRHSAGSSATTPGPTSSKQTTQTSAAPRYSDAGTSKQSGLPQVKPSTGKRGRPPTQKTSIKSDAAPLQRPKPAYTNASTQCDLDQEEADQRAAERAAAPRKKFVSLTQRLLQRCATNNARSNDNTASKSPSARSLEAGSRRPSYEPRERSPMRQSPIFGGTSQERTQQRTARTEAAEDISMTDGSPDDRVSRRAHDVPLVHEPTKPAVTPGKLPMWSHHAPEPPVPPWPADSSPIMQEALLPLTHGHKPADMHLQMPPPQAFSFAAAQQSNSITGSTVAQSPASLSLSSTPLFSPAVTAAVAPSSARKKLSLSDYTKRTKAKDRDPMSEGRDRESSPASVASGSGLPIVPGLPHSSSQFGSQAVEDDVKMEDATGL
ncbi:SET domain-containing protein 3 [Elasticomyces elasticus]|nr:SET domain-containing protein 3 [Elasticomyces elasticus]